MTTKRKARSEPGTLERREFTSVVKSVDDARRRVTWTISTATVDRQGDTIAVDGWQLDEYRRNPTILWAHDTRGLPVAKCTDVHIDVAGKKLVATGEFAAKDVYPFADTVFQLIRGGFLNATSVGFRPLEWKFADREEDPNSWFLPVDFLKQELLEFSVVPVPANPEALISGAKAKGIDTRHLTDWAERFVAASRPSSPRGHDDDIDIASISYPVDDDDIDLDDPTVLRIVREVVRESTQELMRDMLRRVAGKL